MADIKINITGISAEDIKSLADKISIETDKKEEMYYVCNDREKGPFKDYDNKYEAIVKYEEEHNVLLREVPREMPEEKYSYSSNIAYLYTSNSRMLARFVEIPNDTYYEIDEGNITDDDYPDLFLVRTSTLESCIDKIMTYTGAEYIIEVKREEDKEFSYDLMVDYCVGDDLIDRKYYNLAERPRYKYYFNTFHDSNKNPIYFDSEKEAIQYVERNFKVKLVEPNEMLQMSNDSLIELICCTQIGPEEKIIDSKMFYRINIDAQYKKIFDLGISIEDKLKNLLKNQENKDANKEYYCWNDNELHGFPNIRCTQTPDGFEYIYPQEFKSCKEAITWYENNNQVHLEKTTITKVLALEDPDKFTILEHHYPIKVTDNDKKSTKIVNKVYYEKI